jgi:hypothetical protein
MPTPKPRLDLDRASDGSAFIAVTYYDATGTPEQTSVLSHAYGIAVDSVMKRKFEQMLGLMAGNITSDITDAFKRSADNGDSVKSSESPNAAPESDLQVLVSGDPFDGLTIEGPYPNGFLGDGEISLPNNETWWIVDLNKPTIID